MTYSTDWFGGPLSPGESTLDKNQNLYLGYLGNMFNSSGTRSDPLYYNQLLEGSQLHNNSTGMTLTPEEYDKMINPNNYYTRWTDAGVNNLYNTLFGRQADQGGFDYWTNLAKTNGYDYNQIKSAMMNTPEYLNSVSTPTVTNTYNNNNTYTPQTAANITGTSSPVPTNTQPLVDTSPANTFRPFNFSFKPQVQPEYHTQQSLIGSFNK